MRAFVLSGGGSLGPAQVGALRALLESEIYPDMVVGCSVGALNAAFLAREVSLAQLERLAALWRSVTRYDVYPGSKLSAVWRFISGKDSLFDNRNFYAFLQRQGTTPATTFASLRGTRLYVTATHLRTGRLHVFGDNPHDRLLDALMASTALTPMHPPWEVDGERYIDGGTVTPLPLRVAVERGAQEIYSLHLVDRPDDGPGRGLLKGVTAHILSSVTTMLRLQAEHDLLLAEVAAEVKLHHIEIVVAHPPSPVDFSQPEPLFELGYTAARSYLERLPVAVGPGQPIAAARWRSLRSAVERWWSADRITVPAGYARPQE